VLIIGGGPGGSTLGTLLSQNGVDVGLFEREAFPRFRIGESLLPASMDILKETGFYKILEGGQYLRKYGAQFIGHHVAEEIYFDFADGLNPDHEMAFEVPRAKFDSDILDFAIGQGLKVYQPEQVREVQIRANFVEVTTNRETYRAKYVADASGRSAFLGKQLKMSHPNRDFDRVAVFAHYVGVQRPEGKREGDIIIGILPDRSWSWMIPFLGNRTSVGAVVGVKNLDKRAGLENYLQNQVNECPFFKSAMKNAKRMTEVQAISNYSHQCETTIGERWITLGDAAVFLDPVFSSGVHLSLYSAKMAAQVMGESLTSGIPLNSQNHSINYEAKLQVGVKRFHSLIRIFYDSEFVTRMQKMLTLKNTRRAFTAAIAGDMWNEDNFLFKMGVF